jgi:mannose-6-phosphate isomerase-like protein (cupin superfamily)
VTDGADGGYAISSLDQLAEDERYGGRYGFRKVRRALGVTAFGVNAVVYPPGYTGFAHWHEQQDELYFVHSGTASVEVGDEKRELGPGGVFHVRSTTPRRVSNAGDDDLVLLIVGGKGGYVGRDGQMMDPADVERRASFGRTS